jgi:transposase InsO family protein
VRYQFIQKHLGQFSLQALCRVMQVSRSGYADWQKRLPSRRALEEQELLTSIRQEHHASRGTYGSPRLYKELREKGIRLGRHRLVRIMHKYQITARPKRRFVVTTQSDPALPVAPNLLDREFTAEKPNRKWTSDITYIWTGEGWLYLAVLLDLFSRRVVGWAMGESLERELVLSALDMALRVRKPEAGLLCHSDRGSQYASDDYQKALQKAGAVCSMSRKGNCYDNAPAESFFASLKRELVHRTSFATREEARAGVFEWIAVWYNRKRRHSSLGYVSPEQFEQQHQPLDTMRLTA